tara:strand:- start:381 stop:632 length:252 start_codon:yes stop_codon:yes gene_type:complete
MEETPVLQIKINNLTAELLKTKTVLDQTRELLKSAEQESRTLKATLEGVLNNKQEGPVRKIMSDIVEVVSNMKFQSPIVRKGS